MLCSTDWNNRMTGRYIEAWSKYGDMFYKLENVPGIMTRGLSYKFNFDSMQNTNGQVIRIDEKFALLFIEWIHKKTLSVTDSEDTVKYSDDRGRNSFGGKRSAIRNVEKDAHEFKHENRGEKKI